MKVYFETYGCALNRADEALMKSLIIRAGYEVVSSISDADVIVVNTCTVRLDTEDRVIRRIKAIRSVLRGKKLVVAGCMASAQPYTVKKVAPEASLLSPQNITRIVDVIKSPKPVHLVRGERDTSYLGVSLEGAIATIPIAEGCLGDCSFCIVKVARRRLRSYKPSLVVNAVKSAVDRGAVEIDLTAQDTASYGIDLGNVRLPDLLMRVLDGVDGDYRVRIGMMNPDTLIPILDDLIPVLRDRRVYKYLHIPLQSGDDYVLKIMKRRYTYDEYREVVKEVRSKVEGISIATDVIVGHPGEDEEAFRNTVSAVKELLFDKVHLAQYTIRPRTESASLAQVPDPVKKRRSSELAKVVEDVGLRLNREYIGSLSKCLITHRGFRGHVVGRTFNYKPVIIRKGGIPLRDGSLMGKHVLVRINEATFYDLRGEVVLD
ncbi:MAG: 2-methylthioadenine synthetase [Thermoprotei archaeon]|nr:MAG: 2-methylthioadenine synthetase [Thermoprotei archaeon]